MKIEIDVEQFARDIKASKSIVLLKVTRHENYTQSSPYNLFSCFFNNSLYLSCSYL